MIQPIFRMKGVLRVKIKLIQDAAAAECITHAGTFHADEVFATVILGKVFGSLSLCRVNSVPAEVRNWIIIKGEGTARGITACLMPLQDLCGNGTEKS